MIFKLLVSLEKLSYGTLSVKEFEIGLQRLGRCKSKRPKLEYGPAVKNHLQVLIFGYKEPYALLFH
jgi:hypothetical protein